MKIVNIVPGFGGTFYCGNCLRDSAYVNSLRELGHDAITLPMYLPLTMNGESTNEDLPVFYGAVNIYLKQQFPMLRHMPGWMENFFDSKPMLKYAAKKSGRNRCIGLAANSNTPQNSLYQQMSDDLPSMINKNQFSVISPSEKAIVWE